MSSYAASVIGRYPVAYMTEAGFWTMADKEAAAFREYLRENRASLQVAFFQDEYDHVRERYDFIDQFGVDWIYTLLAPPNRRGTYGALWEICF